MWGVQIWVGNTVFDRRSLTLSLKKSIRYCSLFLLYWHRKDVEIVPMQNW